MQVQGVLLIDTNPSTRYIEEDKRKLGIAAHGGVPIHKDRAIKKYVFSSSLIRILFPCYLKQRIYMQGSTC